MSEWKPIETAPEKKDAEFLVKYESGKVGIARYLAPDRMLVKSHQQTQERIVSWAPFPA